MERASRIEQRFIWMMLNYPLWRDFPPQPVWSESDRHSKAEWLRMYGATLVRAMKEDGIISPRTDYCCVPNIGEMMEALKDPTEARYGKYLVELF